MIFLTSNQAALRFVHLIVFTAMFRRRSGTDTVSIIGNIWAPPQYLIGWPSIANNSLGLLIPRVDRKMPFLSRKSLIALKMQLRILELVSIRHDTLNPCNSEHTTAASLSPPFPSFCEALIEDRTTIADSLNSESSDFLFF